MKKPNREELFNRIFDMLEELDLVNWTKIYNRQYILEAFSQIDKPAYKYCNKSTSVFSAAMLRLFNKHKEFTNYKGRTEKWDSFLLRLISYKKCSKCNTTKTFDNFSKTKDEFVGIKGQCKECISEYYSDNKKSIDIHEKNRRQINKEYIVEKLGNGCAVCRYNENLSVLDIHHKIREPNKFPWTIDSKGRSKSPSSYLVNVSKQTMIERLDKEIYNLELLCKNCHQEYHMKN